MTGRAPTDQEIQDVMSLTSTSMEQFCERMRGLFAQTASGVSEDLAENIETVHYAFEMFADARGPLSQARHMVALADAVSDLASYHPGYDEHQTLPWQRADQD